MENEFISWLKSKNKNSVADFVELGIGDDAAVFSASDRVVVAMDAIAEGTHFLLDEHELPRIGRKSLAVNLSDMAAMAARPIAATVAMQLPRKFTLEQTQQLYSGIESLAREYDVEIVGGDTNRWSGGLVLVVTVFGVPMQKMVDAKAKPYIWRMDTAKAGDAIFVSGEFGGSIHGRHLGFEPRLVLAEYLTNHFEISAATDASDSLASDLAALASASELGFEIELPAIPVSDAAKQTETHTPLEHALYDGEDFELIICASQTEAEKIARDQCLPAKLTRIGVMTEGIGRMARDKDQTLAELKIEGYEH